MAVRAATVTQPQRGVVKVVWSGLLNGDTGAAEDCSRFTDATVHVSGTFGVGGSVTLQGSNNAGASYQELHNPLVTTALTFTAEDLQQILETSVGLMRPNVTAGDGTTNLTVSIVASTTR